MREQSFMKSLFFGVIDDSLVFPWPEPDASETAVLHSIVDNVRRFFEARVDPAEIDRQQRIGDDVLRGLTDLGCFGMVVPQSDGGAGLENKGSARVLPEV